MLNCKHTLPLKDRQFLRVLRNADHIVEVFGHYRPDGICLGGTKGKYHARYLTFDHMDQSHGALQINVLPHTASSCVIRHAVIELGGHLK